MIKKIKTDVLEKGKFGNDFDFAYISLPNYGIRNSVAQWRNMEILFELIDELKKHNILVIMGNVDWAMTEVCMARGVSYASSGISGKRVMAFNKGGGGGPEKYGKMPLPDSFDWQDFYSFKDDFENNGRTYPYYSFSATKLNGKTLDDY